MNIASSSGPIVAINAHAGETDDTPAITSPGYLRRRETAARAAAKSSAPLAGRRVHQELAQLMYEARKRIEAAAKNGSTIDD